MTSQETFPIRYIGERSQTVGAYDNLKFGVKLTVQSVTTKDRSFHRVVHKDRSFSGGRGCIFEGNETEACAIAKHELSIAVGLIEAKKRHREELPEMHTSSSPKHSKSEEVAGLESNPIFGMF